MIKHFRSHSNLTIWFAFGILLIFAVFGSLFFFETRDIEDSLENHALDINNALTKEATTTGALLTSLAGIQQTSENGHFTAIAEELIAQYPYIKSIAALELLQSSEITDFERQQRDLGYERFNIDIDQQADPLVMDRHLVLYRIEPLTPMTAQHEGKDFSASQELLHAVEMAGKTGHTMLLPAEYYAANMSGKLVAVKAIYFGTFQLDNEEDRSEQLRGAVIISLDPSEIASVSDNVSVMQSVCLEMETEAGVEILFRLFGDADEGGVLQWKYEHSQPVDFPGHSLRLTSTALVSIDEYDPGKYIAAAIITLLIMLVIYNLWQQNKAALIRIQTSNTAFNHMVEGVIVTDHNVNIIATNKAFTDITGYSEQEILGENPRILSSGRQDRKFYKAMWASINQDGTWEGELWNIKKDGSVFPEHCSISVVHDNNGNVKNYVGIFTDITANKKKEERIVHMAHHDSLTNLPNRVLLYDRIQQAMVHAKRNSDKAAVLFIDLDNFKLINDSIGHNIGDKLLIEVSQRLRKVIRGDDTVSRQGGDEFIVVLRDVLETDYVMTIAERILAHLSKPVALAEHTLTITASIGISLYPDDGSNIEDLIKNADAAMYHAKSLGRATYQFFTDSLNQSLLKRLAVESAIRESVAASGFELHYQPKFALEDKSLVGAEALLRYTGASEIAFSTQDIIRVAEETGMIIDVGEWVISESCRQLFEWQHAGVNIPSISINLSCKQLDHPNTVPFIKDLLERYQLDPSTLQVEITESALMEDLEVASERLQALTSLGISIAIDDFGTGYSSLYYLTKLPIVELKVDKSIISDINEDASKADLIRAVVNLAHNMDLICVAEGIETEQEYQVIRETGCEIGQGYYFSHPLPIDQFERLITTTARIS